MQWEADFEPTAKRIPRLYGLRRAWRWFNRWYTEIEWRRCVNKHQATDEWVATEPYLDGLQKFHVWYRECRACGVFQYKAEKR